jgi:hypothetical protein
LFHHNTQVKPELSVAPVTVGYGDACEVTSIKIAGGEERKKTLSEIPWISR